MIVKVIGLTTLALMVSPAMAGPLRVGFGKAAITPDDPGQFIAGYGSNRVAEGNHDDIWVRAMMLSDGEETEGDSLKCWTWVLA